MCDYVAGHARRLDASLRGDGHPVLVFPGLGFSGTATADLRARLTQLGYATYDWEQGINNGHGIGLETWLQLLSKQLQEIYSAHKCPVSIIGWSLGGTYAREIAKNHPGLVRQVITLATPFGEPGLPSRPSSRSPLQRSTSIYSRTDGIVNWESCVGKETPDHRNIEMQGVSHFGMVHHPDVLRVIAETLKSPMAGSEADRT